MPDGLEVGATGHLPFLDTALVPSGISGNQGFMLGELCRQRLTVRHFKILRNQTLVIRYSLPRHNLF